MIFKYILCAPAMSRWNYHREISKDIVQRYLKDQEFIFGLLYNAMTEARQGPLFHKQYDGVDVVLSDSGGLQVTTLNLPLEETKLKQQEIYKTQSTYSDIAMSFDEMPLFLTHRIGGGASRVDKSNRYFVHEMIESSAIGTANNIKEQIKAFEANNSETKIMLICQGEGRDTYKKYAETIWKNLTPDEQQRIYGIAPSSACVGSGTLDRFDMLYSMKEIDIPDSVKSNVHLLGVGSFTPLLPLVGSPEYFSYINNMTFDSSSASRLYMIDGMDIHKKRIPKDASVEKQRQIYGEIVSKYQKYFDIYKNEYNPNFTLDYMIEEATFFSSKNKDDTWGFNQPENHLAYELFNLIPFFVAMSDVERVMHRIAKYKDRKVKILSEIKTWADYQYYRKDIQRIFRLQTIKLNTVQKFDEIEAREEIKTIWKDLF